MIFTSNLTAKAFLDGILDEMELFSPPSRTRFIEVLDETVTRLYSEIIRHREVVPMAATGGEISYAAIALAAGHPVHSEDILAVADEATGHPLFGIARAAESCLPAGTEGYVLHDDGLLFYPRGQNGSYLITCLYRPTQITADSEARVTVRIATEYLPLLRAKLRGEGYKLAGEDELAAKWLGEYNLLLADFVRYVTEVKERQGT